MIKYKIIGGLLFGVMDGIINANPSANRLDEFYDPIGECP